MSISEINIYSIPKVKFSESTILTSEANKSISHLKIKEKAKGKNIFFELRNNRINLSSSIETGVKNSEDNQIRYDYYGIEISKKNKKKYKVTYADEVNKENIKFIDEIEIESYKKYNHDIVINKNINYLEKRETYCCTNSSCNLF